MKIMTKKINLKITIEEAAERHPVPVLGTDYKVKIIYKNIKVAELDVEDKIIKISLPNKYKKANNERILDTYISAIKDDGSNFIEITCGNMRVNFIDKILKERNK